MVIPDPVDELIRAVITISNGAYYLWKPEEAWKDVDKSVLPDLEMAKSLVREKMGDEYADRLETNFEGTWTSSA